MKAFDGNSFTRCFYALEYLKISKYTRILRSKYKQSSMSIFEMCSLINKAHYTRLSRFDIYIEFTIVGLNHKISFHFLHTPQAHLKLQTHYLIVNKLICNLRNANKVKRAIKNSKFLF